MKIKRSKGERIFEVFNYIFLSIIIIICLYPVWYVAMAVSYTHLTLPTN